MKELVSVIIPVYKVEEYLNQCVDSVLNQTYEELEIILVDDGSPDNCPKICDAYKLIDSRIIVIHKENGGQGTARNLALDICRGQYIAFLDSDDYWESTYIETLLNEMNLYNADIAICNYNHVNENGRVLKNGPRSRISHKVYTGTEAMEVALYWREFGVAPWAKLYRREIWKNVRYNEDRIYEDLATTYKVYFEAQKVVFINHNLMNYRIRSNSDIHQKFNERKIRILDSADEILEFCQKYSKHSIMAAQSRKFASACFIYFRIPDNELNNYKDTVQRCKKIIRKYRYSILLDSNARKKTRFGAMSSFVGFKVSRFIFNCVIR